MEQNSRLREFPLKRAVRSLLCSALFFSSFANLFVHPVTGKAETFDATGSMTTDGRYEHTATLLPNGKVLIAGGYNGSFIASAQLYDPSTGTFSATGSMTTARYGHKATLLPGGKVLVTGGWGISRILTSAELYDLATGTFSPTTGAMTDARLLHTATLLPNGKVLIAGGATSSFPWFLARAELYDPATSTFTPTIGSMTTDRYWHTATLLPNGKVLVAGGANFFSASLASADLYDPATSTFSPTTGSMTGARAEHTETLLPNGKVLAAGGRVLFGVHLASAELYDPTTGTFSPTGSMITDRTVHTATLLPSGKVLVTGGGNSSGVLASAELYDPAAGAFSPTAGPMTTARFLHTATLLPNLNKVLVAGGLGFHDIFLTSAELYNAGCVTTPKLSITLTPNRLWPPQHQLVPIAAIIQVADSCDPNPSVTLVSILSNEPDNGLGDGDTPSDIKGASFGTDDRSFLLRAERSGRGPGRVYTVTYRVTDRLDNTATEGAEVRVPVDQRRP